MKVAPIIAAIDKHNEELPAQVSAQGGRDAPEPVNHVLVHTGQHYDQAMSCSFFADLGLPKPEVHLGVGSGSHASQTAEIVKRFEPVLLEVKPDVLVVVGDVNSTLACALVAAKVSIDEPGARPLVAHVEAGLRSFDRTMPEEINRVLTDQLSDLLFITERSGWRNLVREGVASEKLHFVGNTMIDSLLAYRERAEKSSILEDLGLSVPKNGSCVCTKPYALLTLHRPANVDTRWALLDIIQGVIDLTRKYTVVFPAHPRTRKRVREYGLEAYFGPNGSNRELDRSDAVGDSGAIRMIEPVGYVDFLCLMKNAALVVTDSGGIQEETTCLGIPCVTVRENTERPVTLEMGTNILAGVTQQGIREAICRQLLSKPTGTVPELWDGESARRIVDVLICEVERRRARLARASATHFEQLDHRTVSQQHPSFRPGN